MEKNEQPTGKKHANGSHSRLLAREIQTAHYYSSDLNCAVFESRLVLICCTPGYYIPIRSSIRGSGLPSAWAWPEVLRLRAQRFAHSRRVILLSPSCAQIPV